MTCSYLAKLTNKDILSIGSLKYWYGGYGMILENNLNITNAVELARVEERLSKAKAKKLFESDLLDTLQAGSFEALSAIHSYLFGEIYPFAGKIREVNISKGDFRFAPISYLEVSLKNIEQMPQATYDETIEKYVEMNIAHPFRESNGRSMRIWLDHILKKELQLVVDWAEVDKDDYLLAMERSPIKDIEIKHLLREALSDKIDDNRLYMRGIDTSYYYEGYILYETEDI